MNDVIIMPTLTYTDTENPSLDVAITKATHTTRKNTRLEGKVLHSTQRLPRR